MRHIEHSSAFQHAVAAHDATASALAIVGFFGEHIHVVRVRVTTNGRLLEDLGGPYVLAPVRGAVRSGGRVVGQFEMAIQDDAGYLRLAHLFTGAEILMRTGARQVMGTLSPGPANVPARGPSPTAGAPTRPTPSPAKPSPPVPCACRCCSPHNHPACRAATRRGVDVSVMPTGAVSGAYNNPMQGSRSRLSHKSPPVI